jgi:hypothetical protein
MMPRGEIPKYSTELSTLTTAEQYVFVGGRNWDPTLLYYAKRQGLMLEPRGADLVDMQNMPDLHRYDFYHGPSDRGEVISIRGFYSPVGVETFRIDDSIKDIDHGLVFQSTSKSAILIDVPPIILSCNEIDGFDTAPLSTDSDILQTTSIGSNYIIVDDSLARTPVGNYLHVKYRVATTYPVIRCSGDGTIQIARVDQKSKLDLVQ